MVLHVNTLSRDVLGAVILSITLDISCSGGSTNTSVSLSASGEHVVLTGIGVVTASVVRGPPSRT